MERIFTASLFNVRNCSPSLILCAGQKLIEELYSEVSALSPRLDIKSGRMSALGEGTNVLM
jgi:hypothetical protein